MSDDLFFDPAFFGFDEENLNQKKRHQLREGELREVTILFADIKGFTNLSSRLEPEVIHTRMDELMKIFSRCVTFYGGFVDKYIGDAIMALFGAKQASEQDTERAIRAGFKMLEQLTIYNQKLKTLPMYEDVELSVRIGINTGTVSVGRVGESREGDFTVYGPEVNLASRMESSAPIGRIMLPLGTKKLVEHIFEFEHLGYKEVKGIEQPVDTWSPVRLKSLDPSQRQRFASGFIGREKELEILGNALDEIIHQTEAVPDASQTPPPRPLIFGIRAEAGIGKSRLVYEFTKLHESDAQVIQAACDGVGATPLHLFARLLARYFLIDLLKPAAEKKASLEAGFEELAHVADSRLKASLKDSFALIAWLMEIPVKDVRLLQGGKDLLQHLLLAVNTVLEAIKLQSATSGKPLVLILDDLHWMDGSSATALEHLINSFSQSALPSLVLLMYRPQFVPPTYLIRMRGWQSLDLKPLDEKDITELVMRYTRHLDLSERSIQEVTARSSGNPFYLEEWCNYISTLPEKQWQDMPVPANLNALILSRLDSLPQALRNLLQKAAVIGHEFFVDVLSEVEKNLEDPIDIDSGLSSLEEKTLILKQAGVELSSYLFKHISTRDVAYQTLLIANRKLLHQLTAQAIEKLFPDRLEEFSYSLGTHYLKAGMEDKALPWLKKAALNANRIYDNSLALKLYLQIKKLIPVDDYAGQGELLLAIMEIKWQTGDWKDMERELAALKELSSKAEMPKLNFHALRIEGMLAFQTGQAEEAKKAWDNAASIASRIDDAFLICIIENLLGIWYQHHRQVDEAVSHHQKSLGLARLLNDPQREAKSLNNMGLLYLSQQEYDQALAAFEQSMNIAIQNRLLRDEALAAGNIGHALIVMQKYEDAMPCLKKKLDISTRLNDKYETIMALGNMAKVHSSLGHYPDAIANLQRIILIKRYLGDEEGIISTEKTLAHTIEQYQKS